MNAYSPFYMGIDVSEPVDCCNDAAADTTHEIGDIVSLIVGGPDMVVISLCECGTVEVAWIKADGDVAVDVFPEEALVNMADG